MKLRLIKLRKMVEVEVLDVLAVLKGAERWSKLVRPWFVWF